MVPFHIPQIPPIFIMIPLKKPVEKAVALLKECTKRTIGPGDQWYIAGMGWGWYSGASQCAHENLWGVSRQSDKRKWCGDLLGMVVDVIANESFSHPDLRRCKRKHLHKRNICTLRVLSILCTVISDHFIRLYPINHTQILRVTVEIQSASLSQQISKSLMGIND